MNPITKAKEYLDAIKIHLKNDALTDEASMYAFVLSLMPIPGVQQALQLLDRTLNNKTLKSRFENIWTEIKASNSRIEQLAGDVEKLTEIFGTTRYNKNISEKVEEITNAIVRESTSIGTWTMKTEDWSYQQVLNSSIEAQNVQVLAKNNSQNVVEKTTIRSNETLLHASGNSSNYFDQTKFESRSGSVGMNGISTKGSISVFDSGIGFGDGGMLIFGGNPNLVSGDCPNCKTIIKVDKRQLTKYSSIECNNCKKEFPFTIGN